MANNQKGKKIIQDKSASASSLLPDGIQFLSESALVGVVGGGPNLQRGKIIEL